MKPVGDREPFDEQLKIHLKWRYLENHSLFVCNPLLCGTIYKSSAFVGKMLQFAKALVYGVHWWVELQPDDH
jgi:hypothetical protein